VFSKKHGQPLDGDVRLGDGSQSEGGRFRVVTGWAFAAA
jgi:hypothetical protein